MNVHFIQHEIFEAPGAYLDWAIARKHSITFSKVFEGETLLKKSDAIDLLVVMGGPQSPATTLQECSHFDAAAEIDLIKDAVAKHKKVIGVCLGAQLIGVALGAGFEKSPEKEIGVLPIKLTPQGLQDKNINHFGQELVVGHWHSDMPGLTAESVVLATSEGCPRQIIRYTDGVYGLQCHAEFTSDLVELLIAEEEDFLQSQTQYRFVQKPSEIRAFDYTNMNRWLMQFLDKLTQM